MPPPAPIYSVGWDNCWNCFIQCVHVFIDIRIFVAMSSLSLWIIDYYFEILTPQLPIRFYEVCTFICLFGTNYTLLAFWNTYCIMIIVIFAVTLIIREKVISFVSFPHQIHKILTLPRQLTLNLPTTTIVAQPFNVIKWQLKFNLVA